MKFRRWIEVFGLAAVIAAAIGAAAAAVHAQPDESFAACVDSLRRERAQQHAQVSAATFERYARGAADLRAVIRAATESQPEFTLPVWDYTARLVDAQRIADGRQMLAAHAPALRAIAARRGIDAATVVAVFGVETDYGRIEGRYPVVDATLSRACLALGSSERKRHFFAALWLLQQGLVEPESFRGSWAGAFGMTQFMPGTFVAHMEAADGSQRADIVGSAADALATTARYLADLGWDGALRWGVEVAPPGDVLRERVAAEGEHACLATAGEAGDGGASTKCRSVEQWAALGVRAVADGAATVDLPPDTRAVLLAPAGEGGPAWLVTRNFQALWQYNRADAYALAIGLLADALRGHAPLRGAWPTDDAGLSRAELRALQRALIGRGHTQVVADGYDGPRTRDAVRAEERRLGRPETGRAGARLARELAEPEPLVRDPDAAAGSNRSAPPPLTVE